MGMSDKQFDSYKSILAQLLDKAIKEAELSGDMKPIKEIVENIRNELKKP